MCLAIPAKIEVMFEDKTAEVSILGVTRTVALDLVPQAVLGDYVLIHAGYGIEVVSEEFAQQTLDLIAEFPEIAQM